MKIDSNKTFLRRIHIIILQIMEIGFPLITDYLLITIKTANTNLSTSETTDRNNHGVLIDRKEIKV